MKKYNTVDCRMILVGIIIPILTFFVSMNMVYAYFTATAKPSDAESKTAILKINYYSNIKTKVNSTEISEKTKLLPGDTLSIEGIIQNEGEAKVYCVLVLEVNVTKLNESEPCETTTTYFTISGSDTVEIAQTENDFSNYAFTIDKKTNSSTFIVNKVFDFEDYDNTYQQSSMDYTLTAYAIQFSGIQDAKTATSLLLENEVA